MPSIWYSIIIIGIFTFLIRSTFILLSGRINLNPLFQRSLRFVPISVLIALIIPELLQSTQMHLSVISPRFLAGMVSMLIAWKTQNVILTIATGMLTLYLLNFLISIIV